MDVVRATSGCLDVIESSLAWRLAAHKGQNNSVWIEIDWLRAYAFFGCERQGERVPIHKQRVSERREQFSVESTRFQR